MLFEASELVLATTNPAACSLAVASSGESPATSGISLSTGIGTMRKTTLSFTGFSLPATGFWLTTVPGSPWAPSASWVSTLRNPLLASSFNASSTGRPVTLGTSTGSAEGL